MGLKIENFTDDGIIPKWKNGRQVSARVTFCSPKCRVKGHRAQTAPCNDKALKKACKLPRGEAGGL